MKVILSRKGFDAENGGTASPVMPDGAMLSLPIPQPWDRVYYDELFYGSQSYLDIWQSLKPKQEYFDSNCHLDPDLRSNIRLDVPEGWVPLFGQCDSAETHLENQGVAVGDVFIFFGWFKETETVNGQIKYKRGGKDAHMMFGYLQIGEIVRGEAISKYDWHPHACYDDKNNTIYVASNHLIIDGEDTGLPGAGTFKYSDELVLTMPGMTKSRWLLPEFFKEVNISCHSRDSFKPEGYFQSVRIGQEFVVSEDERVTQWARNIIVNNYDNRVILAEGEKPIHNPISYREEEPVSVEQFDLCNGVTASFDSEKYAYTCRIPLLGRNVDVVLRANEYNDEGIEGMKKTFETFWTEKDRYLEVGQNSIKEKLLPYIAKQSASAEIPFYPIVSVGDFDSKYNITDISIEFSMLSEVKLAFNNMDDLEKLDELSVVFDPESDYLSFEAGFMPILMDDIDS